MSGYLRLRAVLAADQQDQLAIMLAGSQALGSEIRELHGGSVEVLVYLPDRQPGSDMDVERLIRWLRSSGAEAIEVGGIEAADWLASYREHVRPFAIGERWWMDPHPDDPTPAPDGRTRLAVEPRMAFGTGSHESTRLVLLELEQERLDGLEVLDVGTGSGVLVLAAETLGAARTVGLDIDLAAAVVAHQIAGQQEWPASPSYLAGPLSSIGETQFDLVLCNMIPEHLEPLLTDIARCLKADGEVILSGALGSQLGELEEALAGVGLEVVSRRFCGEWAAARAARG